MDAKPRRQWLRNITRFSMRRHIYASRSKPSAFARQFERLEDRVMLTTISPVQMRQAYGIDQVKLGAAGLPGNGAGQTIGIIEIGTGSGCLAVTIACEAPGVHLTATDVSPGAIAIARENATRHAVADRIDFVEGSLFAGRASAPGGWDLVVSNPPYVARRDRDALAVDVRDFEPDLALFGGDDGLEVIRALAHAASRALAPGGSLVLEIGAGQAEAVRALIDACAAFGPVRVQPDLQRIPRVVVADRLT